MRQKKRLDWFVVVLVCAISLLFILLQVTSALIVNAVQPTGFHQPEILVTKEYFSQSLAYGPGITIEYSIGGIACVQDFYVTDEIAYQKFIQHLEDQGRLKWAGQRIKWPEQ